MTGRALRRHITSRVMTVLVIALSFTAVLALVLILGNLDLPAHRPQPQVG